MCKACTGICRDEGSETEPIEIECPACDGVGCDLCDDGNVSIAQCPNRYCSDVAPVVRLGELFSKGLPPVAGGTLDQSAWFMQAVQILERDEAQIKYERDSRS